MLGLYMNARNFVSTRLSREEKGATAVEYGIMVALIAVVIIVAVNLIGGSLSDAFDGVACELDKTGATAAGKTC
ncbi:Flp family type IVb pilin [Arthrobacter crystallopoietes]|uniref:Flp family type IVb pilin n=1 Tax=Crystallibacter crystallopoietes TaxID=37928 RepID=UPI001ABED676|nr:Flp family type IVb pilin [Arthrobacter crystallopoietes]QTG80815.1 Flp family type IVb pilin [Arthrobacter crystallopoietes]